MPPVPSTVKVRSDEVESGFIIINEEDFDKEKHVLFVESAAPVRRRSAPQAEPQPDPASSGE